jgi:hypothetical protein
MASCAKCDFHDAEPDSPYCATCRRGIEWVYENRKPVPKEPSKPTGSGRLSDPGRTSDAHVLHAGRHGPAPGTPPRTVERVPGHEVSPLLMSILAAVLESPPVLPPEGLSGKAPRVAELNERAVPILIDSPIRYVGEERKIDLDRPALDFISATSGIRPEVLQYLLITHGHCHEAMRRCYERQRVEASPRYEQLDDRIREHYSQLVMYYLLFGPGWVKGILPSRFHQSLPQTEATGFLRDFMALDSLQLGPLHVDPRDFTAARPTASIEMGIRLPAHGFAVDFAMWHKGVILRPVSECVAGMSQGVLGGPRRTENQSVTG